MATQSAGTERMAKPGAATEAAKGAPLAAEARGLLRPDHSPRQYLDTLVAAGHLQDAVRFLAYVLPRREAVWWAAQCTRQVPAALQEAEAAAAVNAAEGWAAEPTDEKRRAAFSAGEAAGFGTPAGCAAVAAFWAEGSIAPPNVQEVPAPPHLCPGAVANAALLASVITEPEQAEDRLRAFLTLGLQVAEGKNRWKEVKATAPSAAPKPAAAPLPRPTSPPPPPRSWY